MTDVIEQLMVERNALRYAEGSLRERIAQLAAENERLRDALEEIAIPERAGYYGDLPGTSQTFREIAREALNNSESAA